MSQQTASVELQNERKGILGREFKVPHTFAIIFGIVIFFSILSHIIPSGEFERTLNEATGRMVVVPGSYKRVAANPISFFNVFISVQKGFIKVANIIFFIILAYGYVFTLIKNGTLDAIIGSILRRLDNKVEYLIPIVMVTFGALGATMGMYEEVYGLFPVFIGMSMALGYDALVGGAMVMVGVATGFAAAVTNPFSLGVAQGIIGVPLFSGAAFRVVAFIIFQSIAILYTMRYARRIKANPELSIMKGVDMPQMVTSTKEELLEKKFETHHMICGIMFLGTIIALVFGTMRRDWYINEIAGLFLMMMIFSGLVSGFSVNKICDVFIESTKEVMSGALVCGVSSAIVIVLDDAKIIDTIVNSMGGLLNGTSSYLSATGMLVIQNIINFFISSGSGQAAVTMPILGPIAEVIGLNKQIAVLAFQFGDGFSNMFWPTSVALICGLMRIPLVKWYKFITPLFLIMFVIQVILINVAVFINYM